ncbi:MAG: hypothetical protein OXF56_23690 [Rhodobacteraceae bacterium]|nr:hypothetical protein [Paracoccaceae bacterium]
MPVHRLSWCILVVAFVLSVVSPASADTWRLMIDPETFERMPVKLGYSQKTSTVRRIGPRIQLRHPANNSIFAANENIAVSLVFLPARDGAKPDMATLDVQVKKGWFGKNITRVVMPFVVDNSVYIPEVDFSGHTGKFDFKISISDRRGRTSSASFRITVTS